MSLRHGLGIKDLIPQACNRQKASANDHGIDLSCVTDVLEWILFEQHQVSDLALLDRTKIVQAPQVLGRWEGGGLQCFHRGEACFDHERELVVQINTRNQRPIGEVTAGQYADSSSVHGASYSK